MNGAAPHPQPPDPIPLGGSCDGRADQLFSFCHCEMFFGEAISWTGFLIPRLQARFGALASCMLRALLIAIWHLPLLIYSGLNPYALVDFPYGAWIAQKGFVIVIISGSQNLSRKHHRIAHRQALA